MARSGLRSTKTLHTVDDLVRMNLLMAECEDALGDSEKALQHHLRAVLHWISANNFYCLSPETLTILLGDRVFGSSIIDPLLIEKCFSDRLRRDAHALGLVWRAHRAPVLGLNPYAMIDISGVYGSPSASLLLSEQRVETSETQLSYYLTTLIEQISEGVLPEETQALFVEENHGKEFFSELEDLLQYAVVRHLSTVYHQGKRVEIDPETRKNIVKKLHATLAPRSVRKKGKLLVSTDLEENLSQAFAKNQEISLEALAKSLKIKMEDLFVFAKDGWFDLNLRG